jgi:hypothetical protein
VELVGDEIEDVFPIRLSAEAAVAVAPAELLEVVVQVAHRRLLLRGGGEEASGSASMPAISTSTAANFSSDGSSTGATSFTGLPLQRLIRFLRMLDFPSSNVVQRRQSAAMLPWCQSIRVSVTARLRAP